MRYTRSYLSRQQQFRDLKENFQDDLREFQTVCFWLILHCVAVCLVCCITLIMFQLNHHTSVSFILDLRDEGSEGHVTATIALNYDRDGERPRPGSLKVRTIVVTIVALV